MDKQKRPFLREHLEDRSRRASRVEDVALGGIGTFVHDPKLTRRLVLV
jgi:hypothetical protein